jgi:hypothetical protein
MSGLLQSGIQSLLFILNRFTSIGESLRKAGCFPQKRDKAAENQQKASIGAGPHLK